MSAPTNANRNDRSSGSTLESTRLAAHARGHCEAAEIIIHLVRATGLPPESPLDLVNLSLVAACWPRANSSFFGDKHTYTAWQVGMAALRRYFGEALLAAPELRRLPFGQVLGTVAKVQNFELTTCGVSRALLWAHGDVMPELPDRAGVQRLEQVLCVPGLLIEAFSRVPLILPLQIGDVVQAVRYKCLAGTLEYLRTEKGITVAGMLQNAGVLPTSALTNKVSALTTGRRLPHEKDRSWVSKLDAYFGSQFGILQKFESEAAVASKAPGYARAEVPRYWTEALEKQFGYILRHKHSAAASPCGALPHWNPVSTDKNRGDLGYFTAFLLLPANPDEPRQNGSGIPAEHVSLGLCAIESLWEAYFHFRAERAQAKRNCRGHAAIAETIASLIRPETGALWLEASYFSSLPGVLERCAPAESVGKTEGMTDVEQRIARFRASCNATHAYLKVFAHTLRNDPELSRPSRNPLRKIEACLADVTSYPVEFLGVLIVRLEQRLIAPVTTVENAQLQRLLAVLSIASFRPFRSRLWTDLTLQMVTVLPNDAVNLGVPPRLLKTRKSFRGRRGCYVTMPPIIAANIVRYVREGREVLADRGAGSEYFLLNRFGRKFATDSLTEQLTHAAKTLAPDIFPVGLSPHDIRHLLGCDLFRRFGSERGGELAAESHLDTPSTLRNTYAHEALASFRWDGAKTQEAVLIDALAKARARENFRPPADRS